MTVLFRCTQCGTVVFEIDDGCVVIRSRHHGEKHQTRVPVEMLVKMCQEQKGEKDGHAVSTPGSAGDMAGNH